MPTKLSASVSIQVPFHDADPAGVVWHGHYCKYFELARCKLLETFDYDYLQMADSGYLWPVVDLRVRYLAPAVFNQVIKVNASLLEYEYRLRISYQVTDEQGRILCEGQTDQVPLNMQSKEMELGAPEDVIERVRQALKRHGDG